MRYLMLIKVGSGMPPVNDELMAAIEAFVEKLKKNGTLVDTGGLQARESGTMLGLITKGHRDRRPLHRGPRGRRGFIIVEVKDKSEAIGIAREFMDMHAKAMGPG